jgi:hypothetical protein
MIRRVFIVGFEGNMARRYRAILNHLNIYNSGIDIGHTVHEKDLECADGILICTPTDRHVDDVLFYSRYKVPILCEKPLSKNMERVYKCVEFCREHNVNLQLINQYQFLGNTLGSGITSYDFYNTGKDGLAWDLISVIGLANGKIKLNDKSPLWRCYINGNKMNIGDMNHAYLSMISKWLEDPKPNLEYIIHAHKKVEEMINNEKSTYRNPGAQY